MTFLKKTILASVVTGLFASLYIGCDDGVVTITPKDTTVNWKDTLTIPVVSVDESNKAYIPNAADTTKMDTLDAFDVMVMIGKASWDDVVDGTAPTSVTYYAPRTTDSTMMVELIRKKMANADDWQSAFANAKITSTSYDSLTHVIISYHLGTNDTVAFFLTDGVNVEHDNYGGFRVVLEPTTEATTGFVTDTFELSDFTMNWADAGSGFSNNQVLADSTVVGLKGIAFGGEAEQSPTIEGDTLDLVVAGIIFAGSGLKMTEITE